MVEIDELLLLLTPELDETTVARVAVVPEPPPHDDELDNSSVEEGPSPESPVSDITDTQQTVRRREEIRR